MANAIEVADIFRQHGETYRQAHGDHMGRVERRVMGAIIACRTATLGGHVEQCTDCGKVRIAYNSCRNRHCPKCQNLIRAEWLDARRADLLPVPYFHVVFTLPPAAAEIAFQNKAVVYDILMRTTAETLRTIAADPKHLGAEIGLIAVLHTWGQNLHHHPHVHCVVPGGGLSPDGTTWVACQDDFFLPVRVLSAHFRHRVLDELTRAHQAGRLNFYGALAALADPAAFTRRINSLRQRNWVVYSKPPIGDPQHVLDYLARYTHRVAISNSRLVALEDGHVSFRWKDYRHGGVTKVMTLTAEEFIRRFLLHSLPDRFQRIRHYGLLANGCRAANLARCRSLLDAAPPPPRPPHDYRQLYQQLTGRDLDTCPCCGGRMVRIAPMPRFQCEQNQPFRCDSS